MPRHHPKPPEDILELLTLVKAGRLFDVQSWIADGQRVQVPENNRKQTCPLFQAIELGFHSMVEVLLKSDQWEQEHLDRALNRAVELKRMDLAELLIARGAAEAAVDFENLCRIVQPEVLERFLRAGSDPAERNAFARGLSEVKARPLLRFCRSLQDEFPVLRSQASLALAEAVREKQARWVALLVWAGADPFLQVPDDLWEHWDFKKRLGRTAAEEACWSGSVEIIKSLQLKKWPERIPEMLDRAAHFPTLPVMKELLHQMNGRHLNTGDPPSSPAVEHVVAASPHSYYGTTEEEPGLEIAACLELLLDAGGKWHPDKDQLKWTRSRLAKHSSRFVVRILRLLVHTPGAADPRVLADFCGKPPIYHKIREADRHLLKDIEQLEDSLTA